MQSLLLLTRKNLQLLLRTKASSLIIIFAPLLLILILGLSFNTAGQYGITVGVQGADGADTTSFMALLEENDFNVERYEDIEKCSQDIKRGFTHTCVSLPDSLQVTDNTPREITFYVDPTRIQLVWMIQETVGDSFNLKAKEITQQLTQNIFSSINKAKDKTAENKNSLNTVLEKSSSATSVVSEIKDGLSQVQVGATLSNPEISIVSDVSSSLASLESSISSIKDDIDASSLSNSSKDSFESKLDNIIDDIVDTQKQVEGENVTQNATASSVLGVVTLLKNDILSLETQIKTLSQAVESSSSKLSTTQSTLTDINTQIQQTQSQLDEIVAILSNQQVSDPNTISSPLTVNVKKVQEEGTYLNSLFPTILLLVLMFSSLVLGTTLVMMEKNSPAFVRNFFVPIKKTTFIISIYVTNLILILIQIIIILGLSLFFLPQAAASIPAVALILFIASTIFTFIGMILGYVFKSEETGVLASISVGSLFLLISGVVIPIEALSSWMRSIAAYNPFVIGQQLIRNVFIFDLPLSAIWQDLLIILGYAIVLFFVILILENFLHQHLIRRFLKHHHKKHRQEDKRTK